MMSTAGKPRHAGLVHSLPWKIWLVVRTIQARLRFIAILAAIGLVITNWNVFEAHWEKWTRGAGSSQASASGVEFYCPMHPQVIRDKPDKCPICAMPLSERKRGDAISDDGLPPGVRRVQLSPYRMALAGIKTSEVAYRALTKEINTVGFVEFDERNLSRIAVWVTGKSRITKLFVNVTGQTVRKGDPLAELYSPDLVTTAQNLLDARSGGNRELERMSTERLRLWGIGDDEIGSILATGKPITRVTIHSPISGHIIKKYQVEGQYVEEGAQLYDIADLSTVWIEAQIYEDEVSFLKDAEQNQLTVSATTKAFPGRNFTGKVAFIHPHLDAGSRTLKVRFNIKNPGHDLRPGMYANVKLDIPVGDLDLFAASLLGEWRDQAIVGSLAQLPVFASGGLSGGNLDSLIQIAGRYAMLRRGLVLAVPESAVIDTGSRKFVYREPWPGVYDGVEVQLGPRSGGYYSVGGGLELGDKVVTIGSFLVDAETRLTSGAASTYFGASGTTQAKQSSPGTELQPSTPEAEEVKVKAVLSKLSRVDQRLAGAQGKCPILQSNLLGSMGIPVKIILNDQPLFLCCKACEKNARDHPTETLATVERLKRREKPAPAMSGENGAMAPSTATKVTDPEEAEARAMLAKLSPEDRRIAESQVFCPIQGENRLGSMGVPVRITLKGQPVFLCCRGCVADAQAHPDQTLAAIEKLKTKAAGTPPAK